MWRIFGAPDNRERQFRVGFRCLPTDLEDGLDMERVGVNVGCGSGVEQIHRHMMASLSDKNNITDRRFVSMGVGTAKSEDGILYMCQIFSD